MARSDCRARPRGATLVEVLVGCGVFAFLMLSSIAIMNIGTGGFRGVESKADVARQLNQFEADITTELKRASRATVGVYTPTTDYRWALWFKTPMNDLNAVDSSFQPKNPLGSSLQPMTDANGEAIMQRYILYYVTRMDPALHQAEHGYLCASYGTSSGPDLICPHKWVVKKEIYLLKGRTSGDDTIGPQGEAATISNLTSQSLNLLYDNPVTLEGLSNEAKSATGVVNRAQIVARNVLSFEVTRLAVTNTADPINSVPTVSASGPIVLFDLKVFKTLSGSRNVQAGRIDSAALGKGVSMSTVESAPGVQMVDIQSTTDATGNVSIHTRSTLEDSLSSYTVQLDNRVIPQNP